MSFALFLGLYCVAVAFAAFWIINRMPFPSIVKMAGKLVVLLVMMTVLALQLT